MLNNKKNISYPSLPLVQIIINLGLEKITKYHTLTKPFS